MDIEQTVCFSNHFLRLRTNRNKLIPEYLNRYLSYLWNLRVFENMVDAWVNQASVRKGDFLKIELPLPPLEEQKRIAAILDKADAIRQKRQKAIDLADEFLRSVFLDMFGDPVTNPKGWEIFKFEDAGALDRGKSKHRPRNDPKLLNGKYPLIQTGDIANSGGYITKFTSTYSEFGLAQSKIWSVVVNKIWPLF